MFDASKFNQLLISENIMNIEDVKIYRETYVDATDMVKWLTYMSLDYSKLTSKIGMPFNIVVSNKNSVLSKWSVRNMFSTHSQAKLVFSLIDINSYINSLDESLINVRTIQ